MTQLDVQPSQQEQQEQKRQALPILPSPKMQLPPLIPPRLPPPPPRSPGLPLSVGSAGLHNVEIGSGRRVEIRFEIPKDYQAATSLLGYQEVPTDALVSLKAPRAPMQLLALVKDRKEGTLEAMLKAYVERVLDKSALSAVRNSGYLTVSNVSSVERPDGRECMEKTISGAYVPIVGEGTIRLVDLGNKKVLLLSAFFFSYDGEIDPQFADVAKRFLNPNISEKGR